MEKTLKIEAPAGFEIDKENSSFELIRLKEIRKPSPLNRDNLSEGVYVVNGKEIYNPQEWGSCPADGVGLVTKYVRIFIDKKDCGSMNRDAALKAASTRSTVSYACRLMDRVEGLGIYDHKEEVNEIMKSVGGDLIPEEWHWTGDMASWNADVNHVVSMGYGSVSYVF